MLFAIGAGSGAGCIAHGADDAITGNVPLKHAEDVPLPGHASRFDYESYDPDRQLLFIAQLGDSEVVVFDTLASRVVARIPGISAVHGVLVVPELFRVYASVTGTNEIVAIDGGNRQAGIGRRGQSVDSKTSYQKFCVNWRLWAEPEYLKKNENFYHLKYEKQLLIFIRYFF
jgi:hypothetical protein